jgi:DNA-binding NarL/FixJ family response regulator
MTRVLLVDDHQLVREGIRALLEREPGVAVVGEAGDGQQALRLARELRPEVVFMDLSLPGGLGGLEAAESILAELPQTKIVFLTQHDSREYVKRAVRLGAHGYLLKRGVAAELGAALRAVARGERYLHPAAAAELVDLVSSGRALDEDEYERLTPREKQVVKLLAEGRTSREIAKYLGISLKTAMTHRAHVMEKLGFHSRTDLVRWALRRGVIAEEGAP